MATLFGFSIKDKDPKLKAKGAASPVPPVDNDATSTITPFGGWFGPVSYTHLTLPTICSV